MGFATGFIGGLTLTYSLLYLSVYLHRNNRTYQSLLLNQQSRLLDSKTNPNSEPDYTPPSYRVEQAGLSEQLKDRWNRELEERVRQLQDKNWDESRVEWEERIGNAWAKLRGTEVAQRVEDGTRDLAQGVQERGREALDGMRERGREAVEQVQQKRREIGQNVRDSVDQGFRGSDKLARDAERMGNEVGRQKRLLEL